MPPAAELPRLLVLHNRYRRAGGEERALELHLAALRGAGVVHEALERRSEAAGSVRAAAGLLAGGLDPGGVGAAVRRLGADVVHVHNMQPLFGPRALAAAREAGARTVLQLHNFRLSCAIGVSFRFGEPCFRCRGRLTLPGLVLNCRGSLPESAVYATALAAHRPTVTANVDRFVAPSRYAVGQLAALGVPAHRLEPLPHYLPAAALARESRAGEGSYALATGRLGPEKGLDVAIDAAHASGIPLKIAGDGPLAAELRARADGAAVELLGAVSPERLSELRAGAAMAVVPSRGDETFGFAALEAMGAGLPVVASRSGALPEVVGAEWCVPRGDHEALAERMIALWRDPDARRTEGEAQIARARDEFGEERFVARLLDLYRRLG